MKAKNQAPAGAVSSKKSDAAEISTEGDRDPRDQLFARMRSFLGERVQKAEAMEQDKTLEGSSPEADRAFLRRFVATYKADPDEVERLYISLARQELKKAPPETAQQEAVCFENSYKRLLICLRGGTPEAAKIRADFIKETREEYGPRLGRVLHELELKRSRRKSKTPTGKKLDEP